MVKWVSWSNKEVLFYCINSTTKGKLTNTFRINTWPNLSQYCSLQKASDQRILFSSETFIGRFKGSKIAQFSVGHWLAGRSKDQHWQPSLYQSKMHSCGFFSSNHLTPPGTPLFIFLLHNCTPLPYPPQNVLPQPYPLNSRPSRKGSCLLLLNSVTPHPAAAVARRGQLFGEPGWRALRAGCPAVTAVPLPHHGRVSHPHPGLPTCRVPQEEWQTLLRGSTGKNKLHIAYGLDFKTSDICIRCMFLELQHWISSLLTSQEVGLVARRALSQF